MVATDDAKVDKSHVERRVKDWKKRISDLYATIKGWIEQSEYSIKTGGKLTMLEELMDQFGVHPVEIDTADVYKDKKIILTLKPKGLWVIGSNGRIDILSADGSYMLVDTADQFKTPRWKLYNGDKRNGIDFTKQSFLQLLK